MEQHLYLSYNVANSSSLAGLNQLLTIFNPLIIFLQELTLTSEQLVTQVGGHYDGLSNIDEDDSFKPGNAVLWRKGLDIVVTNIVKLRLQLIQSPIYGNFINIYAPSGTQGERGRRVLFSQHLLTLTQTTIPAPVLCGDWNCLIRKADKETTSDHDPNSTKLSVELKELVRNEGYIDGFLAGNPNRLGFT